MISNNLLNTSLPSIMTEPVNTILTRQEVSDDYASCLSGLSNTWSVAHNTCQRAAEDKESEAQASVCNVNVLGHPVGQQRWAWAGRLTPGD